MTVLAGDKAIVESFGQFRCRLDVTTEEVVNALPDESVGQAVEETLGYAREEGWLEKCDTPVEAPGDFPRDVRDDLIGELVNQQNGVELIETILDNRDGRYVHLYDGTVHTIVTCYE